MSYADVNGISLYYEEHGSGQPLILLHGGLSAASMYAPILAMLAKDRRVIAVDLQAHGHTADVDRPLRFETLGGAGLAPRRHPEHQHQRGHEHADGHHPDDHGVFEGQAWSARGRDGGYEPPAHRRLIIRRHDGRRLPRPSPRLAHLGRPP